MIFSGTAAHGSNVLVEGLSSLAPREGTFWADKLSVSNSSAPWTGTGRVYAQTSTTTVRTETCTVSLPQASQSFTYDDDGNLTADGVWTYTYDAENRLIAMETASGAVSAGYAKKKHEFKYDAGGRRVEKKTSDWVSSAWSVTSTHRYLYDGWNLIGEYSWNGSALSLARSYTWGLDLVGSLDASGGVGALLQMRDHSGSATYLATYDGNGNVAALLNASDGSVAASYEYSPFGELLRKAGAFASANPFRFSTKFTDDETSLSYYGMRYYSPSLGRFLNRDPIEEAGGLNLYGFCSNNPVSLWDRLGMEPKKKGFWKSVIDWLMGGKESAERPEGMDDDGDDTDTLNKAIEEDANAQTSLGAYQTGTGRTVIPSPSDARSVSEKNLGFRDKDHAGVAAAVYARAYAKGLGYEVGGEIFQYTKDGETYFGYTVARPGRAPTADEAAQGAIGVFPHPIRIKDSTNEYIPPGAVIVGGYHGHFTGGEPNWKDAAITKSRADGGPNPISGYTEYVGWGGESSANRYQVGVLERGVYIGDYDSGGSVFRKR